ncbi:hypothetical protein LUZ60_011771 [Juncus effusus]|nr:hypothetical protein LUZ60_011771 [Juncus effusus]
MEATDLSPLASSRSSSAAAAYPTTAAKRPAGIPPAHPHPPHYISPQNLAQIPTAVPIPTSHSRSLSQPSFFSLDSLPPLNPSSVSPSPSPRTGTGLPPRKFHRRSHSDVPVNFTQPAVKKETTQNELVSTDDLVNAYMNLENLEMLNSSEASGTKDSSENEVESSSLNETGGCSARKDGTNKRGPAGELVDPANRGGHCRSLSMDSLMGRLNFTEDSPKLGHSRSGSMDGSGFGGLELVNGDFNELEMKKIKANEKLVEMAITDPKRVKRILANRQSAARSKERKMRYISELEHKVQTLQTEATTLSAQLTLLQRDSAGLANQNNELKIRLQSMEQQAQLRDALNEALTQEVQRLKLQTGEINESHLNSNSKERFNQQFSLNSQMMQQMQQMHLQQQQQKMQQQKQQQQQRQEAV